MSYPEAMVTISYQEYTDLLAIREKERAGERVAKMNEALKEVTQALVICEFALSHAIFTAAKSLSISPADAIERVYAIPTPFKEMADLYGYELAFRHPSDRYGVKPAFYLRKKQKEAGNG